ncbi:hypothetical protein L2W58_10020 [Dethiosulfovibrio sp. F2B]|nr:SPFH domain-containing protein [Dethiosulfovibrio faecalis]MCF4152133.1 hypothetical protein [Dethiosulfovibrio faecalis]
MIWRFLPIGAFFVCLLLLGLSSLEIVPSGYRAVLLRWGRPVSELSQGIHLKYPWPIDRTVLIDIGRVRRIHVGSHSPTSIDGNIYVKGVPILWTNEHGLRSESYLPVSPPADIADVVMGERVPSVSLVGADVFVEFRIVKPLAFLNSGEDGIELFRKKAERTTSRTFVKYDVDTIIGKGRREAAQKILEELKVISDSMNLGLSVEYVGIVGVHPPQIVASFFEETVSALQEKETVIQWARQAAILRMTETVGDAEIAEDLIGEISSVHGRSDEIDSVLMKSGGKVASVLGEAVSYKVIRESDEEVRYERFLSQFNIFSSAPSYYGNSLYLDVLDKTLPFRRKYLIPKDRDDMMFGLSGYSGPGKMDHRVSC